MIRRDGRHPRVLDTKANSPAFSPDGRHIVFHHSEQLDAIGSHFRHTFVDMRLRDRQTRTIVSAPATNASPTWQPLRRR